MLLLCDKGIKMPKVRGYDKNLVILALNEVKSGSSIHAAAKKFGIPRSTLQNRLHNRTKKSSFGPDPVLTFEEEQEIVDWLVENHAKSFPRRKQDVQSAVKDFLDASPRQNPFKNNLPGEKWYTNFLKRHPELAIRTPEAITDASSKVSENNIRKWFDQIEAYLKEKNYTDVLNDSSRIYNGDETNFMMCPKSGKVIAPKGTKNVYEIDRGQAKENLTVMFSLSASGLIVPPLIIFPYKRVPNDLVDTIPEGLKWMKSDSGWMTKEVFFNYIKDVFYPTLVKESIVFPVILYVDGHRTHLTYELSKLCKKLNIILICLYPNSTRVLQPADVSVFKPLKTGWQKAVLRWRKNNIDKKLTKLCFAPILKEVVDTCLHKESIKNGFRTCGLWPFSPDAIDYIKCLGKNLKYTNELSEKISENDIIGISEKAMTIGKFEELIGVKKFKELQIFSTNEKELQSSSTDDLLPLLKIYKFFVEDEVFNKNDDNNNNIVIFENDQTEEFVENIETLTQSETDELIIGYYDISEDNQQDGIIEEDEPMTSLDLPVIFLDDPSVQIHDFLPIPQTPARVGTKIAQQSFIISSTPFQESEENKMAKKLAIQKEKEERIKTRKEKAILKEKQKIEKTKNKIKKRKTNLFKENVFKQKQINVTEKPDLKTDTLPLFGTKIENKPSNLSLMKLSSKQGVEEISFCARSLEIPSEEYSQCNTKTVKPSHVRLLFTENKDPELNNFENEVVLTGICFECAKHITSDQKGIKCSLCERKSYHISCALKINQLINSYDNDFTCKICNIII